MTRTLAEWANLLGATLHEADPNRASHHFALDSREVKEGSIFCAIRGERVDGHDFCAQALDRGAAACLVERSVDGPHLLVSNLVEALASMASKIREGFFGPVIAVTGSAGKTTAKEFISAAMSSSVKVAKTEGNRNTEFSAPLLWAEMDGDEGAIVAEMSMRGLGQIRHLISFTRPTLAVITNIGDSHLEMVGSREGVFRAKAEILEGLRPEDIAVLPRDDDYFAKLAKAAMCRVLSFGVHPESDMRVISTRVESAFRTVATLSVRCGEPFEVEIPAAGAHFALNAGIGLLTAVSCGIELKDARLGVSRVHLPAMRMEASLHCGITVLFDAYNASPTSYKSALEAFEQIPVEGKKWMVAGEMKELGEFERERHLEIVNLIGDSSMDRVMLFGEAMTSAWNESIWSKDERFEVMSSHEQIQTRLHECQPGDGVLLKASRGMELERALPDAWRNSN